MKLKITTEVDNALRRELNSIVEEIKAKHIELGQKASGRWTESLTVQVDGGHGVILAENYTKYLTKGVKPNKYANDNKKLSKWAYGMAKNNPQYMAWVRLRGVEKYAVQIAFKIGKKGTDIYKRGGTDLIDGVITDERIKKMKENIKQVILVAVNEEIVR